MSGISSQAGLASIREGRHTPLVRNEHGAVLGIDFRQSPLAAEGVRVPGTVPVHAVLPGDGIDWAGQRVTVKRVAAGRTPADLLHVITRTSAGAEVALEFAPFDQIEVVSTGWVEA